MKKVIKPSSREESLFYSDFTGAPIGEHAPQCEVNFQFHFGSAFDGEDFSLHLSDEDFKLIFGLVKPYIKNQIPTTASSFAPFSDDMCSVAQIDKTINGSIGVDFAA